jgi:hypothetical protein
MEHAGYIGRGDDHGIGLPLIGETGEIFSGGPMFVPPGFGSCRFVMFGEFHPGKTIFRIAKLGNQAEGGRIAGIKKVSTI